MVIDVKQEDRRIWDRIHRMIKASLVGLGTLVVLSPTWISFWEDRPIRGPIGYYLLWWDDTRYASRYSQRAFNSIDYGDDIASVNKKLGSPLTTHNDEACSNCSEEVRNQVTNIYSAPGGRSNYWYLVMVVYDKRTRKVIEKNIIFDD